MSDETRRRRQIERYLDSEARWLQKVLFSLGKARDARTKLAELSEDGLNPLITLDDGTKVPLDRLEEVIQKRVAGLMEDLGRGVHGLRS